MWLLVLAACHGPSETGPAGMVGRIVDAAGAPLAGIGVNSVEAQARTDADGHFAVAWKSPGTHIFFEHDGVYWQRPLQEGDSGRVELRLPELRQTEVVCADLPCQLTLDWELGSGLTARVARRCESGGRHELEAPAGEPAMKCVADGAQTELVLDDRGEQLVLRPPSVPLRVEIEVADGSAPEACEVHVGDEVARSAGPGFWVADQRADSVVRVVCEDRPSWPVEVAFGRGSVTVGWSRGGPILDLEGRFPEASALRVRPLATATWLEVAAVRDGVFPLPPIPAGTYAVAVVVDGAVVEPEERSPSRAGVLELRAADGGGANGALRVESDMVNGRLPVTVEP